MSLLRFPRCTSTGPLTLWFLLALAIAATPVPASGQVLYKITDLGTIGSGTFSEGYGINASGQVAGRSTFTSGSSLNHAFRTTPAGRASDLGADLGTLGGPTSHGLAINASGQVTGWSDRTSSLGIFRTSATGRVSDPDADLGISGFGHGINATGQVTGSYSLPPPPLGFVHAFRSSPNGRPVSITDLGVFPGGVHSDGRAINDAGQVAGFADTAPGPTPGSFGPTRAFRTTATGLVSDPGADLGTLGGSQSQAFGINNSGQVVGRSFTADGLNQHAFRSSPNGQPVALTDLGTLGGNNSVALAINSLGVLVGSSEFNPASFLNRAFIYDTQMRDLNSLIDPASGWILGAAYGINDSGQIVGVGNLGGQTRAFRLTPVPEPGGALLTGGAILAWAWRRRSFKVAAVWHPLATSHLEALQT